MSQHSPMPLSAPPALREGDTIAVVAPAGPIPMDRLGAALSRLEKRFRLLVSDDIDRRDGFLAGSDERRAEEFNAALANPDVRAIWAARGGYGCSRIVSLLDDAALTRDPVPIVGFSDLTVLLCWAASLGLRSVHAPVIAQLSDFNEADTQWVIDMLLGKAEGAVLCEGLLGLAEPIEGRLIGGNLSLLAHLCGTTLAPPYAGSICLLEDIRERPYAIDRHIGQLLAQPGERALATASAVVLGEFTDCEEASDPQQDPLAVARARVESAGLPCASGALVGHGLRNRAFPFGARARLAAGTLQLIEQAVEPA